MTAKKLDPVHSKPSPDVKDLCDRLCRELHHGNMMGLIAIPIYKPRYHRRYNMALAGWAAQYPTYALGAITTCATLLREMALQESNIGPGDGPGNAKG